MDVPQRFCVRWNSYKSNLQTAFPKLLTSEHFVDVTLACEKQYIKCHKIVLSACSVYFETLLVNNPCQHPIIFMKDVQFWEIKALVEFMYKGEVNVSQNQLDSLLKSAESLQIRGLSGTKQFINFEQSDDNREDSAEVKDDSKTKRSKSENEEVEEENLKKKKRRNDEEEKCVQITSVKGADDLVKDKKSEETGNDVTPSGQKVIKEETSEHEEFDFESNYMDPGEEDEGEEFSQDVFYPDHSNDPGPSGISGAGRALGTLMLMPDAENVEGMRGFGGRAKTEPSEEIRARRLREMSHGKVRRISSICERVHIGGGERSLMLFAKVDLAEFFSNTTTAPDLLNQSCWLSLTLTVPDAFINTFYAEFISLDQFSVDDYLLRKQDLELNPLNKKAKSAIKAEPADNLKLKKPSTRRSCYKQYTMASMWAALERIEQGLSVYRASLEYGVPRKTLRNWMKKYNILSYFDLRKQEREKQDVVVNLE